MIPCSMKSSESSFRPRRLSFPHVAMVHLLVALLALPPGTVLADMLTSNVLGGGAAGTAGTPASTAPAAANAVDAAAAAAQARANAQDMLTRNTMALQAVTAMQDAARAAAAALNNAGANPNFPGQTLPDVPNGLGTGGLEIIGSPVGANAPQQSLENARTIVTIQQTQQQALLNWKTFNVGGNTTVRFDQSEGRENVGNWIAFNTINDPSGNPTQILGSIEAKGQVYLINQNGIIFGGRSIVNTHTLVASSLPLNGNLVTRGLLNNPDSQFLFSANAQAAGNKGPTLTYTPPAPPNTTGNRIGNVTVQAGARLSSPTSSANVGGRVALIGPNVTNQGTISTPDGQTILAAGMEVGFDAHSSDDASLRGLDVYVGSVGTYGGTATNAGLIESPRGSVVMTGKNVNQDGFINSNTSVSLNGRIDLLANYNAVPNTNYLPTNSAFGKPFVYSSGTSTGIVSVGSSSVMQILPQWSDPTTINGTELALKSQVNLQGLAAYLGKGSVIYAPNGNVSISAGVWDLVLGLGTTLQEFVASSGQVYADANSVVDVSGSTAVSALVSDYILTVALRGAELADSALQRNSFLRGQTVTVDLRESGVRSDGTAWYGTPLANLSGYVNLIPRNAGQLTIAGGSIKINAGESVVLVGGSRFNVSGGYQNFGAATVDTTLLVSNGRLVDIAKADSSVIYDGIPSQSPLLTGSRVVPAHTQGGRGGNMGIRSPAMALDGSLEGGVVIGDNQLSAAPAPSELMLAFQGQKLLRDIEQNPVWSPTPPSIEFRSTLAAQAAPGVFNLVGSVPAPLKQERKDIVYLPAGLLGLNEFGSLSVENSDGDITVPHGVILNAAPGGSVILKGSNITIEGGITAPGGSLDITAYNISPYVTTRLRAEGSNGVHPPANVGRGIITLGSIAFLDTGGLLINLNQNASKSPRLVQSIEHLLSGKYSISSTMAGGAIKLQSYSANLAAGSVLDVSGGFLAANASSYGAGGTLSILSGNDPLISSLIGGALALESTLRGFSGSTGATLRVQAPLIQIGGTANSPGTLALDNSFFQNNGFQTISLTGLGAVNPPSNLEQFATAITVSPGFSLNPLVRGLVAAVNGDGIVQTSTNLATEGYRNPFKLELLAPGLKNFVDGLLVIRGHASLGVGSRIQMDALSSLTLNTQTADILGSVDAPGGVISIRTSGHYPQLNEPNFSQFTLYVSGSTNFSVAGKTLYLFDALGRRRGSVLDGGSISVSGNAVIAAGSFFDASGTSATLDLTPGEAGLDLASLGATITPDAYTIPTQVSSNGGKVTITGSEVLYHQGIVVGRAGGTGAQGGAYAVKSGRFTLPGTGTDDKDITMVFSQQFSSMPAPLFTSGISAVGQTLGGSITSLGYAAAESFSGGGFDSIQLTGNVQFSGSVTLSATGSLLVANGGVISALGSVNLSAPYVAIGQPLAAPMRDEELINPFQRAAAAGAVPSYFSPVFGTGSLQVSANLIEAGFLSLQNIGNATLISSQDFRGSGYLDMAGNLAITAGQIYPITASTFNITAYNYSQAGSARNGSLSINTTGATQQLPYSGAGRLGLYAATINQGGVLRAPFGIITLGWDGTGTAPIGLVTNQNVPVTQQVNLLATSITSVSAIDPVSGSGVRIPYGIVKDGTNWIDPTGLDITTTGVPDKSIRVAGLTVRTDFGSLLDIRGGGELYGYRWIQGNGGTTDVLNTDTSFAILPGNSALFSPFAPFATIGVNVGSLGGDPGYSSSGLKTGDRVYLKGSSVAAAGSYTLLPARYALLPGALLVTPDSTKPNYTLVKPGGAVLTTGYRYNSLNPNATGQMFQSFEIAPASVVRARSEYADFSAQNFISSAQQRLGSPVTSGPLDAGYAYLGATSSMQLKGGLLASGSVAGRGGRVDISSPLDIIITAQGAPAQAGKLVLDAAVLSGWNAESLIIGGVRSLTGAVTARTSNLTLDNATSPLKGMDILLVASQSLTLNSGATVIQSGVQTTADNFVVSGNGAMLRVSGSASTTTTRTGFTVSGTPFMNIAANAQVSGISVVLDSSNAFSINSGAILTSNNISLNSGRISIVQNNPPPMQNNPGLVLSGQLLSRLQNASKLSLLSYSSIDFYGGGTFTVAGALEMHASQLRGFTSGAQVNLAGSSLVLDNSTAGTAAGIVQSASGSLSMQFNTITIGLNAQTLDQFDNVSLNAPMGVNVRDTGSFRAQNNLSIVTSFISGSNSATQVVGAGGTLSISRPSTPLVAPSSLGVGSQITFEGATVNIGADIRMPSGSITARALTGNLTVSALLDAGGVSRQFFDTVRYAGAGGVTLSASSGNVSLTAGSVINLAASPGGGDAGNLFISASGRLTLDSNSLLLGAAGTGGKAGSIRFDLGSLSAPTDLTAFNNKLNDGKFTENRDFRVRSGDVAIDGQVITKKLLLGVDNGSVTVTGVIDASGTQGGYISLSSTGNLALNAFTLTGGTLSQNNSVLNLTSSSGLVIGQSVSGPGITPGTYVTAINGNQATLSQPASAPVSPGTQLSFGARLTVRGQNFDNAGKGGEIWLESGASRNGVAGTGTLSINAGTSLDLGVDAKVAGVATDVGSSAFYGKLSGKVHLRVPQQTSFTNIQMTPIAGTFIDPSSVEIEGYRLYSYNQPNVIIRAGTLVIAGETITTTTINTNNTNFFGASNVNYNAMFSTLVPTALQSVAVIMPGVEIVNTGGTISLGTPTSAALSDWNLGTFRYGPKLAPGVLTLRAAGNLEFYNTLSDGFQVATAGTTPIVERMWMAPLMTQSTLLPLNSQSWSYRMAAGGDLSASSFREVTHFVKTASGSGSVVSVNNASGLVVGQAVSGAGVPDDAVILGINGNQVTLSTPLTFELPAGSQITFRSSLLLGKDAGQALPTSTPTNNSPGVEALTRLAINPANNTATTGSPTASNRFQVIRSGTGGIDIYAAGDAKLLNQFATIYTAGVQVASATTVFSAGDFTLPQVTPNAIIAPSQEGLGAVQQLYPARYSMAGGNVMVSAGGDIIHQTRNSLGILVDDSSRELPNNWLMRRGYVDPATGRYGAINVIQDEARRIDDNFASTTWWVNFSNFFDGVATLGGGNVTLIASRDVKNVSAHAATNARAANNLAPTSTNLLELGGGDVTIRAGRNIDGGVFYVERGLARLYADGQITTNSTRSPSLGRLSGASQPDILPQQTWLPTTLLVGKASFSVAARGDVLLGPVANTMLLPQGVNNKHWYKTYFSTYAPNSTLQVESLTGNVTFRQNIVLPQSNEPQSAFMLWMNSQMLLSSASAGFRQPWLRLIETNLDPFNTFASLMPGTLRVVSFIGEINLVGRIQLSPSPSGGIELLAGRSVNGLAPVGVSNTIIPGAQTTIWGSSSVNLSDASPASMPAPTSPFTYFSVVGSSNTEARQTRSTFMQVYDAIFTESGSTTGNFGSIQAKQTLHAPGVLHASDSLPVLIYASQGDISGLTFFSSKSARILAGQDITDIGLYIQNVRSSDVSLIASARDIIAYNANSVLRSKSALSGNLPAPSEKRPKSGDIQISGPGTLQVLAGRDLNLGTGSNNSDGTGVGFTSIGNGRNPYLPFAGADVVVAAGMGGVSTGLGSSNAKFADFIYAIQYAHGALPGTPTAPKYNLDGRRYLGELAEMIQINGLRGLPLSMLVNDPNGPALSFDPGENVVVGGSPAVYPNSINLDDPALSSEQRNQLALALYFLALRDSGRDRNNPDSPDANTYRAGYEAIDTLFPTANIGDLQKADRPIPGYIHEGNILTQARNIRTKSGGSISILAPGGGLQLASTVIGETLAPPGIITESGGNISVFADQDVSIGIARIFTLRGGDINIWSTVGNIAAGSSSKTVQSAPPTRVLIDPQSANVATDLAGLATGGGIGVLATVAGVAPGNVDLIAPIGAVDAGDAGIRATGNLNIAAAVVLNAANISVGGTSAGTPAAAAVASPSLSAVSGAASSAAAATSATNAAQQNNQQQTSSTGNGDAPSIITVEVLGYGGGSGDDDERRRNRPGE